MLPDVYFYNPTCDFAVANGTASWQPNRLLRRMEAEMANLPQFLSRTNDVIIVPNVLSAEFSGLLTDAGFGLPSFSTNKQLITGKSLTYRPFIDRLMPWGWSPAAHHTLASLKPFTGPGFSNSPVAEWKAVHRELMSRNTAAMVLRKLLEEQDEPRFLRQEFLPKVCRSLQDIEIQGKEWGRLMIKLPWSSSGRGLQPVTQFPVHPSICQRIGGMIRDQGVIFAEPLLDKVFDLGFLYEIRDDNIRFLGHSRFFTGEKGQYKGNFLNGYPEEMEAELAEFLCQMEEMLPGIHLKAIRDLNFASVYQGPLGIDTLIFRDSDGQLKINPCLEINWRFTMGHVALSLEKHIAKESKAIFRTYYNNGIPFSTFTRQQRSDFPLGMKEGKISRGFLPLTEFSGDNVFGAYLSVEESRAF